MKAINLYFTVERSKETGEVTADIYKESVISDKEAIEEPILRNVNVIELNVDRIKLQLILSESENVERNLDSAMQILYQYMCEYALPKIKFSINAQDKPKYRVAIEKAYVSNLSDITTIELRYFITDKYGNAIESNHLVKGVIDNNYILDNGDKIPFQTLGEFFTRDHGLVMEYISHDKEYPSSIAIKTLLKEAIHEKEDKFTRLSQPSPVNTIDLFSLENENTLDEELKGISLNNKRKLYSMLNKEPLEAIKYIKTLIGSEN